MAKAFRMIVAVSAIAAFAACLAAAPATQPAKSPSGDGTYHGVFKFGTVKFGFSGGKPWSAVAVAKVEGGSPFDILVPEKFARGKIDMEMLKDAEPGDLLEIVCSTAVPCTLMSMKKYDFKWGEDEPNVFVFSKKGEVKTEAVTNVTVSVTRFLQPFTMVVPNKKGADGSPVPDEAIMKTINALKDGDLVELMTEAAGGRLIIRSARYLEPYRKVEFVKVVKGKVGMDDLTGVEVKEGGGDSERSSTARFYLNPKGRDFAGLLKTVGAIPAGAETLVRTVSDDRGNWLVSIRPPTAADSPGVGEPSGQPPRWIWRLRGPRRGR
ncbi:MAG: hypothetical protein ACE15C_16335 [Phycisphaerae bacterium]